MALLGEDRDVGRLGLQDRHDGVVAGHVGLRQWRVVALVIDGHGLADEGEDGVAACAGGPEGEIEQWGGEERWPLTRPDEECGMRRDTARLWRQRPPPLNPACNPERNERSEGSRRISVGFGATCSAEILRLRPQGPSLRMTQRGTTRSGSRQRPLAATPRRARGSSRASAGVHRRGPPWAPSRESRGRA